MILFAEDSTFDKLAHDYGAFVAIIVVIGPAIYKALTYLATRIVEPLAQRHIQFIDELSKTNEVTKHTLNTIAVTQEKIANNQTTQTTNESVLVDLAKTKLGLLSDNKEQVHKIMNLVEENKEGIDRIEDRLNIEIKDRKDEGIVDRRNEGKKG